MRLLNETKRTVTSKLDMELKPSSRVGWEDVAAAMRARMLPKMRASVKQFLAMRTGVFGRLSAIDAVDAHRVVVLEPAPAFGALGGQQPTHGDVGALYVPLEQRPRPEPLRAIVAAEDPRQSAVISVSLARLRVREHLQAVRALQL